MTRSKKLISALLVAAIMIAAMYGVFMLTVNAAAGASVSLENGRVFYSGGTTPQSEISSDFWSSSSSGFDVEVTIRFATNTNMPSITSNNVTNPKLVSGGGFSAPSSSGFSFVGATSNTTTLRFTGIRFSGGTKAFKISFNYTLNNSASLYSATADINLPEFQDRITDPTDPNGDDDDPGLLTPYIIVRNYTYNSSVTPGNDLTVTANMYNESGDVILRNIYLEISGSEGVVPKSATNSILIKELGTGNHTSIKMTFQTPDELSAQSVQITYSFTFQYLHEGKYQDGKATQVVNIPIRQGEKEEEENEDRFSISMVDVPTELYIGQEGYLTVTVINKGKKQVSNVSAIIVSDNLTNSNYTEYYGAVLANTKAEIELPILANEAGQFSGTVIVEYEDADDNLKTLEKEITMNWMDMGGGIVDPWPWPEPEPEPEPEPSGMPWWAWVAIGVGVIVVIVVISKLVKRRREKQLEVEDEDF